MSDGGTVQDVSNMKPPKQHGKGGFAPPVKMGKRAIIIVLCLIGIVTVILSIQGPPPTEVSESKNLNPENVVGDQVTNLPTYQGPINYSPTTVQNGPRKVMPKLLAPKVLTRPTNLQIPPGSIAKAVLLNTASNGLCKAKLTQSVSGNGETFIEAGTILIGQGQSSEDRLNIRFNQAILKDGSMGPLDGQAADVSDQVAGLKGSRLLSYSMKLGAGIGLNFLSGVSQGLQETQVQNGVVYKKSSMKNALLNGTQQVAMEEAQNTMQNVRSRQPPIVIQQGTEILIIFTGNNL